MLTYLAQLLSDRTQTSISVYGSFMHKLRKAHDYIRWPHLFRRCRQQLLYACKRIPQHFYHLVARHTPTDLPASEPYCNGAKTTDRTGSKRLDSCKWRCAHISARALSFQWTKTPWFCISRYESPPQPCDGYTSSKSDDSCRRRSSHRSKSI